MLASLIAAFASGETVQAARRFRRAAIVYLLAAIAATVGLGFLVGAGFVAAAGRHGTIEAALAFGTAFLVVAALVVVIHRISSGVHASRVARRRSTDLATIGVAAALAMLPSLLRGKGGLGVLVGPALAAAAYAIYKENRKPAPKDDETV